MSRRFKILLFCGVIVATASLVFYSAFSHSGRTDSSGGHRNRKTGEYHYHGTSKAPTLTPSSGTQSSTIQSGEIAELASEMKRLRASVEALEASVQIF